MRHDDVPAGGNVPSRSATNCRHPQSAGVRSAERRRKSGGCSGFRPHLAGIAFTERTERILSTVAVQVSIGIANANLYRDVCRPPARLRIVSSAILSHELRTPLNPVFAILTALEEHKRIPPDVRQDLVMMRRNLELEARLIDDLLDPHPHRAGKDALNFEPNNLHDLIDDVCRTCQGEARQEKDPSGLGTRRRASSCERGFRAVSNRCSGIC